MQEDLFSAHSDGLPPQLVIAPGATLLRAACLAHANTLLTDLVAILARSPWRDVFTPGGRKMSVQMSNCGKLGWISDRAGYRYSPIDPHTRQAWPLIPATWQMLAHDLAQQAGYPNFEPEACLINRYEIGAKMSLHQDKDEEALDAPIVSLSLGLPANFLFGGPQRQSPCQNIPLHHGDALVWGGPSRLWFHGIQPIKPGHHPITGNTRINLTFRRVNRT